MKRIGPKGSRAYGENLLWELRLHKVWDFGGCRSLGSTGSSDHPTASTPQVADVCALISY